MKMDDATLRQIKAADPTVSTWLSANAGSGKTRVLTNRVARLLLEGTSPQNILCLTYTKAAASEMQNRLFQRLGEWAMMDDTRLGAELSELGANVKGGSEQLAYARTLFARAIDTPGGLRIQTIHSFCAALLRRFPLEAGISPVFQEVDDRAAKHLRDDILEAMADGENMASIADLAAHYTGDDFAKLAAEAIRHREAATKPRTAEEIWSFFELPSAYSVQDLMTEVFQGSEPALFEALLPVLRASEKPTDQAAATRLAAVNISNPEPNDLALLFSVFLFGPKTKLPYGAKTASFPTKDLRCNNSEIVEELHELMVRVELVREQYCRLLAAQKTLSFYRFAKVFLPLYKSQKLARGWLDFDDLITGARDLLSDPAVAQWVLFRLDGGLDHILVDEAQDTSPDQWKVVELLAQEFGAGHGARAQTTRTIFVVGDYKQSIYSFQGADPKAFEQMRRHFANSLERFQQELFEQSLEHSFRSSPAILGLVDAVFQQSDNDGVGGQPNHLAFHQDMPGRVDLWNIVEKSADTEEKQWYDPTDKLASNDHRVVLAEKIARNIQSMVESESIWEKRTGFRPIGYGDFLILVQRRSKLFDQIIRACKALNLPIAGADRLKLGAEIAVKDLQALLSFLALPQDSLSLAAALRSPLFDVDEAELFGLACGREEKDLWPALVRNKNAFSSAFTILSDLRDQVDFLGPFELLERILTRHGGRARLLARLGPEAEDGIDALLTQAITYETVETPSITGFLIWMTADGVEIKRQSDNASGRIRVMTTHGAKGLESPIVILPDSGDRRAPQVDELIPAVDDTLMWRTRAEIQPTMMKQALMQGKVENTHEMSRLLYVALTRAEGWLIVCASGEVKEDGDSWYRQVERGMLAAGAIDAVSPTGPGLRLQHGEWVNTKRDTGNVRAFGSVALPEWVSLPEPVPKSRELPISPSDLGGQKLLPGDGSAQSDALLRGALIHLLLEKLPEIPADQWTEAASQLLAPQLSETGPLKVADLLAEARKIIKNPKFSEIFSPQALAEVSFSAIPDGFGGRKMRGTIDRLVINGDRVLVVDFKSNQVVPATETDTPSGILCQMAGYLGAVQKIYPDYKIDLAILWTHTATLMPLSHDIVRAALQTPPHLDVSATGP